jgi:hypothetical protein
VKPAPVQSTQAVAPAPRTVQKAAVVSSDTSSSAPAPAPTPMSTPNPQPRSGGEQSWSGPSLTEAPHVQGPQPSPSPSTP